MGGNTKKNKRKRYKTEGETVFIEFSGRFVNVSLFRPYKLFYTVAQMLPANVFRVLTLRRPNSPRPKPAGVLARELYGYGGRILKNITARINTRCLLLFFLFYFFSLFPFFFLLFLFSSLFSPSLVPMCACIICTL